MHPTPPAPFHREPPSYFLQAHIHQTEGARSTNASTAVHNAGADALFQHTWWPHSVEKVEKHICLWDTKVRPVGIVEVWYVTGLTKLQFERIGVKVMQLRQNKH